MWEINIYNIELRIVYCAHTCIKYALINMVVNDDGTGDIFEKRKHFNEILSDFLNNWYSFLYFLNSYYILWGVLSNVSFKKFVCSNFISYSENEKNVHYLIISPI